MHRRTLLRTALASIGAAAVPASRAEDRWPARPITYIVPFGAGGTTDILARLITPKAASGLQATFVIENKPGAGGSTGTELTARAAPDGYTVQGGTISSHAINAALYSKLGYDPIRNFQPITLIGSMPNVLVVRADSPLRTLGDVVNAVRTRPGTLNYASSGSGTSQHLSAVFFEQMTGGKMVHVPYKSSAESLNALLSGQGADLVFENLAPALPQIRAGKLRAIAVTSERRASLLPDLPSISETLPGYAISSWQGVFAPAGVSPQIVQRLAAEMIKAIRDPEIQAKLLAQGVEPSGMSPADFAAFQKSEVEKWARVVKTAGIRLD